MEFGLILPQGWIGEYSGWSGTAAWNRTEGLAIEAETLGFESLWFVDHLITGPDLRDEICFEAFVALSAIARQTSKVGLGHLVLCAAWRNPALTAKMSSSLDVISGGRLTLGIGAGWKEDEWVAYGYEYPSARQRLRILEDHLEIIDALFTNGRASVETPTATVTDAVNVPRGAQEPRIPMMIGGNGPEVTWRLAARFADELNLDGLSPSEVAAALPVIASRCEEIGRHPDSLRVSAHVWSRDSAPTGEQRVDLLGRYGELGIDRVITGVPAATNDHEALSMFARDIADAGFEMDRPPGIPR